MFKFLGAFGKLFSLRLQLLVLLDNLAHALMTLTEGLLDLVLHGVVAAVHVTDLVLEHLVDLGQPLYFPFRVFSFLLKFNHFH